MIETDFGRKSFWIFLILEISHIILFYNVHISSGIVRGAPPLRRAEGGGGTPTCTRPQSRKYYKIVKKWPKNASREVEKLTPSPFGPRFFPPRPPLENALTMPLRPACIFSASQYVYNVVDDHPQSRQKCYYKIVPLELQSYSLFKKFGKILIQAGIHNSVRYQ